MLLMVFPQNPHKQPEAGNDEVKGLLGLRDARKRVCMEERQGHVMHLCRFHLWFSLSGVCGGSPGAVRHQVLQPARSA